MIIDRNELIEEYKLRIEIRKTIQKVHGGPNFEGAPSPGRRQPRSKNFLSLLPKIHKHGMRVVKCG